MAIRSESTARRWPAMAAALVLGLNVFDALFTLVFVQLGVCQEANPVMRAIYRVSPGLFVAAKVAAVTASLAILLRLQARPLARAALAAAAVLYVAVAAYELAHL